KEIGKTRTVIISTHILSEVEMLCGRVIIISHGKIAADSPTSELRTRFGNTASIHIQAAGCTQNQLEKLLTSFDGVSSVRFIEDDSDALTIPSSVKKRCGAVVSVSGDNEIRPLIVSSIAEKGWTLYDIALQRNSLEDVFRTLTTGGVQ
ncbi:MAG TPA: ABC transporter ATP-binding protein, partial [Treponemataceae bacterium]|nr:ABC transporter ATP-binding protein [Treponemataceae bacterium]